MAKAENGSFVQFTPEFEEELKKGPVTPGEREQIIASRTYTTMGKKECDKAFFAAMSYNLRLWNHNRDQAKEENYITANDFPDCARFVSNIKR